MGSERDEVLSLNDEEEGSFSGFSPLNLTRDTDSDMEPATSSKKKPKSVVSKVTNKSRGAKTLVTKSNRGGIKKKAPVPSTSKNKENVTVSQKGNLGGFDISKLSSNDIVKLREVLGINNNSINTQQYADDDDFQSVFGQSLDSLPNIHVEVDSGDISDTDMIRGPSSMSKNLSQAMFEPEEGEIVDWDLPKLKVPEKGKAISNSLAKMINVACTTQCHTDTLVNKYKIPENCDYICPPMVNGEIWKVLDKRAQSQDRGMVDIQNLLSTAMTPVMRLAEVLKPHIMANNEAKTLLSDTLTLMGQAQYNLSVRRRYFIRPNLKKKYSGLCNISTPITNNLFGDDIAKDIKNCESVNFLGKDQGYYYKNVNRGRSGRFNAPRKTYYSSGYGSYSNTRFQPYPQRGQQFRQNTRIRGVSRRAATATATAPNDQA